jgi:RNA polymerase sigma factor (TIGR02999 family)
LVSCGVWGIKGADRRMTNSADVTALLVAWSRGEASASAPLIDAVYAELRRMATGYLRRERRDHSLPPTALVHEAYVKMIDQRRVQWQNRAHFFAVAAHVMRRLLVDHARAHRAAKRGAAITVSLDGVDLGALPRDPDVEALDEALDRLGSLDARQAQLVELRFFGGLTVDEASEVLGIAPITVKRDWAMARSWLYRELGGRPRDRAE